MVGRGREGGGGCGRGEVLEPTSNVVFGTYWWVVGCRGILQARVRGVDAVQSCEAAKPLYEDILDLDCLPECTCIRSITLILRLVEAKQVRTRESHSSKVSS